ncbi:MAG: DUF4131 domain-containing protein, partial [Caulobacterales bacterium]|nr:DUF4131 domain-containing protein [Caulobacterales bacterium]
MSLSWKPNLAAVRAEVEAQAERWTLWTPVAFGLGAAAYLTLLTEPPLWAALGLALATACLALAAQRWSPWRSLAIALGLVAFAAGGVLAGKVRTLSVAAPVLAASDRPRVVEGWVVDVLSPGASGGRLLIAPSRVGDLPAEAVPHRVRISVGPDAVVGPGAYVRLRAIVGPPPGPAAPGTYDFARDAFFDRIGGSGFALGRPQVFDAPAPTAALRWVLGINAARWSLAQRIVERMGPET